MNQKLLALYGLKWNPFAPNVPVEALIRSPEIDNFCWRVENLTQEGGFALIMGEPGLGKSVALRILTDKLRDQRELSVGILTRPQASLQDFYRELGAIFDVQLAPHNRWAGTRVLRERWQKHIDAALLRSVLVIDEAQEMSPSVLNELRLLAAIDLDSRCLLTVVLAGDLRLTDKFRTQDLLPLGSRIRVRLALTPTTPQQLHDCLNHVLTQAGNPRLMTPELMTTLTEHAAGNYRILMTMAGELLDVAVQRDADQMDEKLYLEVFAVPNTQKGRTKSVAR